MTGPSPSSHDGNGTAAGTGGDGRAGDLARWQKIVGAIGLALVVVLVVVLLVSGDHGPARHAPGGEQDQPADVGEDADQDPSQWDH